MNMTSKNDKQCTKPPRRVSTAQHTSVTAMCEKYILDELLSLRRCLWSLGFYSRTASSPLLQPRSAYNWFFKAEQEKLRSLCPKRSRRGLRDGNGAENRVRIVADKWNRADKATKAYYFKLAVEDKTRYALEFAKWRQNQEAARKKAGTDTELFLSGGITEGKQTTRNIKVYGTAQNNDSIVYTNPFQLHSTSRRKRKWNNHGRTTGDLHATSLLSEPRGRARSAT